MEVMYMYVYGAAQRPAPSWLWKMTFSQFMCMGPHPTTQTQSSLQKEKPSLGFRPRSILTFQDLRLPVLLFRESFSLYRKDCYLGCWRKTSSSPARRELVVIGSPVNIHIHDFHPALDPIDLMLLPRNQPSIGPLLKMRLAVSRMVLSHPHYCYGDQPL